MRQQTTTSKQLGAVAATQRTPTNHAGNSIKSRWNYKGGFDRARLPSPSDYFAQQGLKLTGGGEWKDAICQFHDDTKPSLRVRLDTGSFKCMVCGAHGRCPGIPPTTLWPELQTGLATVGRVEGCI